jgi:hypothetical protein
MSNYPINAYASVQFGDGPNLDAFGLLRTTGKPGERYNVEFIYDKQPELVDEVTAGSGTATHSANSRDVTLAAVDAEASSSAALYGYDVPYTPGSSQLLEITGAMDGAAIGGGTAQLFLRSKASGTVVETVTDQTDWNIDAVGNADWSKSQIFAIDLQSLRVGRVRYTLVRGGRPTPIHQITNDNIRAGGYWQTASLPPAWRIYNDASYTYAEMAYGDSDNAVGIRYLLAANASATLRAICATVKSEGGADLFSIPGFNRSADSGVTAKTVSTTLIPVLSIRPAATINSIANRGLYIPNGFSIQTNNPIRYVILYRPTLTDASFGAVDATYSGMEVDVAATAVTGGIVVASGYVATDRNSAAGQAGLLGRTLMRLTRTGTPDILTLAAIRTGSSNGETLAEIGWREIR